MTLCSQASLPQPILSKTRRPVCCSDSPEQRRPTQHAATWTTFTQECKQISYCQMWTENIHLFQIMLLDLKVLNTFNIGCVRLSSNFKKKESCLDKVLQFAIIMAALLDPETLNTEMLHQKSPVHTNKSRQYFINVNFKPFKSLYVF